MNNKQDSPLRLISPTLLGIIFAILQGFTVYFTRNVETRISSLDAKLDRTWEITLVTKTELATLQTALQSTNAELTKLKQEQQDTREAFLEHVAMTAINSKH